jgi:hypothetical protein
LLIAENAVVATTSLRASCVRPSLAPVLSTVALLRLDELDNLAQGSFNFKGSKHRDDRQICGCWKTRLAREVRNDRLRAFQVVIIK